MWHGRKPPKNHIKPIEHQQKPGEKGESYLPFISFSQSFLHVLLSCHQTAVYACGESGCAWDMLSGHIEQIALRVRRHSKASTAGRDCKEWMKPQCETCSTALQPPSEHWTSGYATLSSNSVAPCYAQPQPQSFRRLSRSSSSARTCHVFFLAEGLKSTAGSLHGAK